MISPGAGPRRIVVQTTSPGKIPVPHISISQIVRQPYQAEIYALEQCKRPRCLKINQTLTALHTLLAHPGHCRVNWLW